MGLATFQGGIHPFEGKEMSADKPVRVLMPTGELVYPMSQHIGAPAQPLVKKGDRGTGRSEDWRGEWIHFCQCGLFGVRYSQGSRAETACIRQSGHECSCRK